MKKIELLLFTFLIITTSCSKEDDIEILKPSITIETTNENVETTYTSIKINGNVISNGGNEITSRGICWSIDPNPTINDNITTESLNSFLSRIDGLTANSEYYFKAYATNSVGTSYSESKSYRTSSLENTTWDFWLNWVTSGWNAYITFYDDGTVKYDEPDYPQFLNYGTWTLNGNDLSINIVNSNIELTGLIGSLSGNTMNGTYTYGSYSDLTWNAEGN